MSLAPSGKSVGTLAMPLLSARRQPGCGWVSTSCSFSTIWWAGRNGDRATGTEELADLRIHGGRKSAVSSQDAPRRLNRQNRRLRFDARPRWALAWCKPAWVRECRHERGRQGVGACWVGQDAAARRRDEQSRRVGGAARAGAVFRRWPRRTEDKCGHPSCDFPSPEYTGGLFASTLMLMTPRRAWRSVKRLSRSRCVPTPRTSRRKTRARQGFRGLSLALDPAATRLMPVRSCFSCVYGAREQWMPKHRHEPFAASVGTAEKPWDA